MIEEFSIQTSKQYEAVDITSKVESLIKNIKEGIVHIYLPHASAALIINENADPNINTDVLTALDNLIPQGKWLHDKIDGNAAAHIKSAIIGCDKFIPVKDGKLMLGTWQALSVLELDGPKKRRIIVTSHK